MEWYLVQDGAADGAANMAKDEHLFREAERWGRPVLRLYEWAPATLSIGRNQREADGIDLAGCAAAGVPVVRRITGGWAVLHDRDLTYSVVAPASAAALGGTIMATYGAIAQAFLRLFAGLGCEATLHPYSGRERAARASAICFGVPSAYELLVGGKKLVGSAQRRRPEAFLQHGSIPIRRHAGSFGRLFHGELARRAAESMTDLETLGLWPALSAETFRQKLVAAFAEALDAEFSPLPWSEADEAAVAALRERYPTLRAAPRPEEAVRGGPAAAPLRP